MNWKPGWMRDRRRREEELERELRAHLELEAEDRRAEEGLPEEEARQAARRAFGNTALVMEEIRAAWGWVWLERAMQDVRFAVRALLRRPAFTVVSVLSLAIALGANTAIFWFARAIVLRTLPVEGAERLVAMRQKNEMFRMENCCFSYPFFPGSAQAGLGLDGGRVGGANAGSEPDGRRQHRAAGGGTGEWELLRDARRAGGGGPSVDRGRRCRRGGTAGMRNQPPFVAGAVRRAGGRDRAASAVERATFPDCGRD